MLVPTVKVLLDDSRSEATVSFVHFSKTKVKGRVELMTVLEDAMR